MVVFTVVVVVRDSYGSVYNGGGGGGGGGGKG